jgi:hypothetical protein
MSLRCGDVSHVTMLGLRLILLVVLIAAVAGLVLAGFGGFGDDTAPVPPVIRLETTVTTAGPESKIEHHRATLPDHRTPHAADSRGAGGRGTAPPTGTPPWWR